ncbi:hypothetical protein IEE83_12930 [Dyadobacter sp. UP-52]|uniref:Uncharacterized protein n=1 Tax=Dyadobacter subterraneus TaxID=2773304 RepID=A0ABR9WBI6_9BACT|nr:hypothetical protein [Dyadobacter subterraneus]
MRLYANQIPPAMSAKGTTVRKIPIAIFLMRSTTSATVMGLPDYDEFQKYPGTVCYKFEN